MSHKNFPSFFQTLSLELNAQADRVRQLIGSSHWISDGSHKEALLRGMIERYVPDATAIGRAFVVDRTRSSSEQDIVVVDTYTERPLFHQGGLIIAASESVLASISVKTSLKKDEFLDALQGLATLPVRRDGTWQGIYFFNSEVEAPTLQKFAEKLKRWTDGNRPRSTICIRASDSIFALISPTGVSVHLCPGVATAYFMARALNAIASRRGGNVSSFAEILDAVSDELDTINVDF
jgi:hypothetical protein